MPQKNTSKYYYDIIYYIQIKDNFNDIYTNKYINYSIIYTYKNIILNKTKII